ASCTRLFFIFIIISTTTRFTLFPYTTLFRSYQTLGEIGKGEGSNSKVYLADEPQLGGQVAVKEIAKAQFGSSAAEYFREAQAMRSEEHTSELQSRGHLVCRLLLEKKTNNNSI